MTRPTLTDLHIGLDLDHTVFNPVHMACRTIEEQYGLSYAPEDLTEYNFVLPGTGGVTYEDVILDMYSNPNVIREMPPLPGAVNAVQELHDAGATISIITHRSPETFEWSRDALDANDVPYDHFVEDVPSQKVHAETDVDVLIDDSPDQVQGMAEHQLHGVLLLRPHNQHGIPGNENVHVPVQRGQRPGELVQQPAAQWRNITSIVERLTTGAPRRTTVPA